VLVCEVDAKGTLAAAFEAGPLGFEARPVHHGISAMAMNTEDSLREYLRLYVRLPLVARWVRWPGRSTSWPTPPPA
jgi:hypothetical protein